MGNRFVLRAMGDQFTFDLRATNDETILTSGRYRSHSSAVVGIEAVRTNAAIDSRFDRRTADSGATYFVVRASNDEVIGTSVLYSTARGCERGIAAVKMNAPSATIEDETARSASRLRQRQYELSSKRAWPRAAYSSTWHSDKLSIRSRQLTANLSLPKPRADRESSDLPRAGTAPELPYEAAFRVTLPEMKALGDSGLPPMSVDMVSAIGLVLGCLPKLRAMRSELRRHLPTFDIERFDKIEQYALALNQAHAMYRNALVQRGSVAELGNELAQMRDQLLEDAQSLANHGLFDTKQLEACKKSPSYRGIATAVFTLVALFKAQWPSIENRTPVTGAFLQQAGTRALDLLGAVSAKERAPLTVGEAQLVRRQAFTLFSRAYEDARSAIQYLRRKEGDADEIAPDLYATGPHGHSVPPSQQMAESRRAVPSSKEAAAPASDSAPGMRIKSPPSAPIEASLS